MNYLPLLYMNHLSPLSAWVFDKRGCWIQSRKKAYTKVKKKVEKKFKKSQPGIEPQLSGQLSGALMTVPQVLLLMVGLNKSTIRREGAG